MMNMRTTIHQQMMNSFEMYMIVFAFSFLIKYVTNLFISIIPKNSSFYNLFWTFFGALTKVRITVWLTTMILYCGFQLIHCFVYLARWNYISPKLDWIWWIFQFIRPFCPKTIYYLSATIYWFILLLLGLFTESYFFTTELIIQKIFLKIKKFWN